MNQGRPVEGEMKSGEPMAPVMGKKLALQEADCEVNCGSSCYDAVKISRELFSGLNALTAPREQPR